MTSKCHEVSGVTVGEGDVVYCTLAIPMRPQTKPLSVGGKYRVLQRSLSLFSWAQTHGRGCRHLGPGRVPPRAGDKIFYDHVVLLKQHGIYILETMNTGRLADKGVHEFMFVLGQARLKGAVQMIINPVAMW